VTGETFSVHNECIQQLLSVDEWSVSAAMSMYVDARTVVTTVHSNNHNLEVKVTRLACTKARH